jgi:hypothetical protein
MRKLLSLLIAVVIIGFSGTTVSALDFGVTHADMEIFLEGGDVADDEEYGFHVFDFDFEALIPGLDADNPICEATLEIIVSDSDGMFVTEIGILIADGNTLGVGEIDAGTEYFDITTESSNNNAVDVIIAALMGNFTVESVSVFGTFGKKDPKDPPVIPEPATMALFGMGLTGLGLIRRRKAA